MPDNQILNQIKNDPELAQQVMNHLLTEGELFYETLDADKPLRQELLTDSTGTLLSVSSRVC